MCACVSMRDSGLEHIDRDSDVAVCAQITFTAICLWDSFIMGSIVMSPLWTLPSVWKSHVPAAGEFSCIGPWWRQDGWLSQIGRHFQRHHSVRSKWLVLKPLLDYCILRGQWYYSAGFSELTCLLREKYTVELLSTEEVFSNDLFFNRLYCKNVHSNCNRRRDK